MLKFAPVKHQSSIAFLAALVVSILCNQLGVHGVTEDLLSAPPCHILCTLEYMPVCGSDGKTYGNICQLNAMNKCHGTHIRKVHDGPCHHHDHCVPDKHPLICKCPCTLHCSHIFKPVCGTDGITYPNACQLASRNACKKHPARLCHKGPCKNGPFLADPLAEE